MKTWSLQKALSCLIGSAFITLCLGIWGYSYWSDVKKRRISEEKYRLTSILQTGPEREALRSDYFAEVLDLSYDQPVSLYAIDLKKSKKTLLESPFIASLDLRRMPPSTLYVDYEVRHPAARLADYENIAIDKEGYLFPIAPFFSPKELPEIYLGLPPFGELEDGMGREGGAWQKPLKNRFLSLAFEVLHFLEGSPWKEGLRVKRIDVSNAFASSLGQKEIVLFTEEEMVFSQKKGEVVCTFPKILRLMPSNYPQQLAHFFALRKAMVEDYKKQVVSLPESGRFAPRIIDLRIPQLAFVENR